MINVQELFEAELDRRGLEYSIDADSGRHAIEMGGGRVLVSLSNLQRDVAGDQDVSRIVRFVDAIVASTVDESEQIDPARLFWCLEPSDHVDPAEFQVAVSEQVNRVLCHWSADGRLITWVTESMLKSARLEPRLAEARAFANLDAALLEATLEISEVDGVKLGMLGTKLPFKSSLILASNLRAVLEASLGWPLLAVTPDRDFLYLWAEIHQEFAGRVAPVVVREYLEASYPICTEVFRLSEEGVTVIGAFPIPRPDASDEESTPPRVLN